MFRKVTCIECPTGCTITATLEDGMIVGLEGFGCRRGYDYAMSEINHPQRILTTTVPATGLSVKMIPVRTNGPIPKSSLRHAMCEIRQLTVSHPVEVGDVLLPDVLGLGIDLVATRRVVRLEG